jgi:hypothetical protein
MSRLSALEALYETSQLRAISAFIAILTAITTCAFTPTSGTGTGSTIAGSTPVIIAVIPITSYSGIIPFKESASRFWIIRTRPVTL